jgi:hypothetical protein
MDLNHLNGLSSSKANAISWLYATLGAYLRELHKGDDTKISLEMLTAAYVDAEICHKEIRRELDYLELQRSKQRVHDRQQI